MAEISMKSAHVLDPRTIANAFQESTRRWVEEMGEGLSPGRFRFCKTRSLAPVHGKRGQATTCFAVKSAWHIGAWQDWPSDVKEGCVQFIKSFQTPNGNFVDDWLLRRIGWTSRIRMAKQVRFKKAFSAVRDAKDKAVRAETRQSSATLMLLGERPPYPLPIIWQSESAVREFVRSLDWSRPWDAGSHTSHLVSFIAMNGGPPNCSPSYHRMMDAAFDESNQFLDERTGSWGIGGASHVQRINGAMKMLTAYDWGKRAIPYPEPLIDYTLDNTSGEDGCGVLDKLFVLHRASENTPGYRTKDLEKFALDALNDILAYHQKDGGFSFYPTRAQRSYYGALISLGGRQSDMHGTVMFTWACAVALDMLGIREDLGWRTSSP